MEIDNNIATAKQSPYRPHQVLPITTGLSFHKHTTRKLPIITLDLCGDTSPITLLNLEVPIQSPSYLWGGGSQLDTPIKQTIHLKRVV